MPSLNTVVKINITTAATAVAQASFSVPLILGPTSPGWSANDHVHSYTSAAAMLTDGFLTSSPEYLYAQAMFAQPITPAIIKAGPKGATGNQVDVLTIPTPVNGGTYSIDYHDGNGPQTITANSSSTAALLLQAFANVNHGSVTSAVLSGSGNAATLTVTHNGVATYTVSNNITVTTTTPGGSLTSTLSAVANQDNTWYGLVIAGATDADILAAAPWIESNKKLFIASSASAPIATSANTDVGSMLKAAAYNRTGLLYNPASAAQGGEAAWMGYQLPQTPGSNNWAYKTLAGITVDNLTDSQVATLIGVPTAGTAGKNVNVYVPIAGVNVTLMGQAASGQYFDITIGVDWLQSQIQTNIFQVLSTAQKVPYTDAGTALLINQVKAALAQGVTNGLIDGTSPITVSAPAVSTIPTNTRANRSAPPISFSARLQGAFNSVVVTGTVSV